MSYVIEYRGKLITNERGQKDYLRKRGVIPKSSSVWIMDDQGRKLRMCLNKDLVELQERNEYP
jgi:hypothetical protein